MRAAARERALFRVIAHTFVMDADGRLLLLRRANTGFLDGAYTLPGGHLDKGEAVVEAARREVREETCIEVLDIAPIIAMPYRSGVDFLFEAKRWRGTATIGEPERCDDLVWAPLTELPADTAPFVRKAVALREKGVWYHEFR